MILGIGIDIIENNRITDKNSNGIANKILTTKEKEIYNTKIGRKKVEYLSGRFAIKEAIYKAINDYEEPTWKEIETYNSENGKPVAIYKNHKLLVSISHEKNYTIAEAILLDK